MFGTIPGLIDPVPPYTTIEKYLYLSSSPESAAAELVQPLNDNTCLQAASDSPLQVDCYIMSIFAEILSIATQVPWNHSWHKRLAALIKALGKQAAPPEEVCVPFSERYGIVDFKWSNYPTFGMQHAEDFNYKNRYNEQVEAADVWSPQEWLSMNAFLATLVAEGFGPGTKMFAESGFQVLTNTLEITRTVAALEDNVPSAAVWILAAGNDFHKNRGVEMDLGLNSALVSHFKGPNTLNDERWKFWEERFQDLARRADLSSETRGWAAKAASCMAGLKWTEFWACPWL